MALTVDQLREALRAGDSLEEKTQVARLLAFCTGEVERIAITAPATAKNEAIIRAAGYLYDMPSITGLAQANAMRNSGALAILLPYRVHRAGTIGEAVTMAQDSGSPGNPVISITIAGNQLVVTYADGNITTETLPAGGDADLSQVATWAHTADASQIPANKLANAPGGGGVSIAQAVALIDSVVEDWAEVGDGTQIPANKLANAPDGGGTGDDAAAWAEVGNTEQIPRNKLGNAQSGTLTSGLFNGRLPGVERSVSIGWSQTQDGDELVFSRANMHPEDGANHTGSSSVGMLIPPFPPALVGDNTLFQHVWTEGDGPVVQITDTGYDNPTAALSYFDPPVPLTTDFGAGQLFVSTIRQFKPVDDTFISFIFGDGPLVASLADVYDWAETDNTDPIPADKLTLAPDGGGTGDDAATWAEEGNTDLIPAGKLLNAPAGMGVSPSEAIAIVETVVEDWAETGDATLIPAAKLLNAPDGGGVGGVPITIVSGLPALGDAIPGRLYGIGSDLPSVVFYRQALTPESIVFVFSDVFGGSVQSTTKYERPLGNSFVNEVRGRRFGASAGIHRITNGQILVNLNSPFQSPFITVFYRRWASGDLFQSEQYNFNGPFIDFNDTIIGREFIGGNIGIERGALVEMQFELATGDAPVVFNLGIGGFYDRLNSGTDFLLLQSQLTLTVEKNRDEATLSIGRAVTLLFGQIVQRVQEALETYGSGALPVTKLADFTISVWSTANTNTRCYGDDAGTLAINEALDGVAPDPVVRFFFVTNGLLGGVTDVNRYTTGWCYVADRNPLGINSFNFTWPQTGTETSGDFVQVKLQFQDPHWVFIWDGGQLDYIDLDTLSLWGVF